MPAKGSTFRRNGWSGHPLYNRWRRMIARCHGSKKTASKNYEGRGIKVCERWRESFADFMEDMGEPPTMKHQIERKENNGNYEPGNCVWATVAEQANNRRNSLVATIGGRTMCLADWLAQVFTTIPRTTVEARIMRGWPIEKALTIPKKIGKPVGRKDGTKHFEVDTTSTQCHYPQTTHGDAEVGLSPYTETLGNTAGGVAQLVEQRTFNAKTIVDSL